MIILKTTAINCTSKMSTKISMNEIIESGARTSWYFSVITMGIVFEYSVPNFLFKMYDLITVPELAGVTSIDSPEM